MKKINKDNIIVIEEDNKTIITRKGIIEDIKENIISKFVIEKNNDVALIEESNLKKLLGVNQIVICM